MALAALGLSVIALLMAGAALLILWIFRYF